MQLVGDAYAFGHGVASDETKAFEAYLSAALRNNYDAMVSLALCYQEGFGCEVDDRKAIVWLEKACEHEIPLAYYHLGLCYQEGRGVAKDEEKAKAYLEKAISGLGENLPSLTSIDEV